MKNLKQLLSFILNNNNVNPQPPEIDQILQLIHLPPLKILNQLNSIQSNYFDRNIQMLKTIYNQQKKDQFKLEGLNKIITDTPELNCVKPHEKKIQTYRQTIKKKFVWSEIREQALVNILILQKEIEKEISRFPKVIRDLFAEKKETNKRLENFETQIEKIKQLNRDFTEKLKVNINEAPPVAPINLLDTIINTVSTYKHDKSGLTSESKEIIGPINATPVFKPSNTLDIPLLDTVPSPTNSPPPSPKMSAAEFDKLKTNPPVIPILQVLESTPPPEVTNPDITNSNQIFTNVVDKLDEIKLQMLDDLQESTHAVDQSTDKINELDSKLKQILDGSDGNNCTIM